MSETTDVKRCPITEQPCTTPDHCESEGCAIVDARAAEGFALIDAAERDEDA